MFLPEVKSLPNEDISILIKAENHSFGYLCDCGEANLLTVKDCQNLNAVFISHTHIDHFVNFDTILRHQLGIQRKVIICGPKGIAEQVQNRIKSYCWNLIEENSIEYEIREIVSEHSYAQFELKPAKWDLVEKGTFENQPIYENALFEVHYTVLDHKTDSIAYLFKGRDTVKINMQNSPYKGGKWVQELKEAFKNDLPEQPIEIEGQRRKAEELFHLLEVKKGETLGVIMDHASHQENKNKVKDLFEGVDSVFIEAYYKAEDKDYADMNAHSYSTASGLLMKACGVKTAIPVHFSRRYEQEEIEQLIKEFEEAFASEK